MHSCTVTKVLPYLFSVLALASGQEFSFIASRFTPNANLLVFVCEDSNGAVASPMFFRNGVQITVQSTQDHHFFYLISPTLEGEFSCGMETKFGMMLSNPQTLVGEYVCRIVFHYISMGVGLCDSMWS